MTNETTVGASQMGLMDQAPPSKVKRQAATRRSMPDTSHEAAASIDIKNGCEFILKQVHDLTWSENAQMFRAFTADRLTEALRKLGYDKDRISDSGIRARISELRDSGYLEWAKDSSGQPMYDDKGQRRKRLNRITEKGELAIQHKEKLEILRKDFTRKGEGKVIAEGVAWKTEKNRAMLGDTPIEYAFGELRIAHAEAMTSGDRIRIVVERHG